MLHGRIAIAMRGDERSSDPHPPRRELGRLGIAFVTLAVGRNDKLAAAPTVRTRGVPLVDDDDNALRAVALEIELARSKPSAAVAGSRSGRTVRRAARRKLEELSGTRPIVEVEAIELD